MVDGTMHVPLYIGLWLVCLSSRVASSSLGSYTEPPYMRLLSSSCFRAASHRDHYIQSQPGYKLKACGVLCEGRYAAEAPLGAEWEEGVISEGGRRSSIASRGRYGGTQDRWKNLLGHTKYCTVFAREMPFGNYVLLLCTWRQIFRPQTLVCLLSYTLEQVITAYNCRTSKVGIISCANVPT